MTTPMPLQLDDVAIERLLVARSGLGTPADLVSEIMATVGSTTQRKRFVPSFVPRSGGLRPVLVAAALILAVAVGTAIVAGALRVAEPPIAPPSPSTPVTSPVASPSVEPSASASGPTNSTPLPPEPAGSRIVYESTAKAVNLFTLDPATGARSTIGNLQARSPLAGQSIQWAADRRSAIVFADSDMVLARVDVARHSVQALTAIPTTGGRDVVSPAGDRIARIGDDNRTITVLDLDGVKVGQARLAAGVTPLLSMAWAPDGGSLLVSACVPCDKGAETWHVYLATLAGSSVGELASGRYFGLLDWSPDQSLIAFSNGQSGEPPAGGIGILRASNGKATQLTDDGASGSAVWSPDGRRIAFTRGDANAGVYVMNADGSNVMRLTSASSDVNSGDRDPRWSPDGNWIVFNRGPFDVGLGDVWIVRATGGDARMLVANAVADW